MSGPKVVTIVTREEIIDTCLALIAALTSAVDRWESAATRSGAVSDEEIAASRRRISEIQTLLENDKFMDVQKRVPMEIAFLDSDIEAIAQKAASVAAAARARVRRSIAAAQMLRSELSARGLMVPSVLSHPESHSGLEIEAAVAEAFAALAPVSAPETVSEHQRSLAAFHGTDESRQTFADWMTKVVVIDVNPVLVSLEAKLDELRVLDPQQFETLSEKLSEITAEQASSRQGLLVDSLMLDIAAARREALARVKARSTLETLHAESRTLEYGASKELALAIAKALAEVEVDVAKLVAYASTFGQELSRLKDEKASLQRRKALLDGLSELGYAVREGMETAWVENGRVVLSGGTKPGYGIEIGGNPDVALQVRSVAFEPLDKRSVQSDLVAEESFCGEFSALQEHLKAKGGDLKIVRALGVGKSRVKQVETIGVDGAAEVSEIGSTSSRSVTH